MPGERGAAPVLDCGGRRLVLDRPRVMGILNITPDSFSDGGRFLSPQAALDHAMNMVEEGADLIDVGGESTRPGSDEVSVAEELERVMPVIEALSGEVPVPLSVDTSKPDVMKAAAGAGAGFINDVFALQREGALEAARETGLAVCLMHMQGTPRTMQQDPRYDDVVVDVKAFLGERVAACVGAGIPRERLVLDPGFGFGKRSAHNFRLLRELRGVVNMGLPVLVGMSRKSMVGGVLGRPPGERIHGSVAAAVLAAWEGALIVRVHDVRPTVDAMAVVHATLYNNDPE